MSVELIKLTGRIQTNADGRVALGICADFLRTAYEQAAQLPDGLSDTDRQGLDAVNAYAGGIFAMLPDNFEPIDGAMAARVTLALQQTERNFEAVFSDRMLIAGEWRDALDNALKSTGTVVGDLIGGVLKAPAAALSTLIWPVALLAAALIAILYIVKPRALA